MTKRAFLLGCNSAGLEHCERDVSLMEEAFRQHGFDVTPVREREKKAPYYNLLRELHAFVASCKAGDTMVVYFAGHSRNAGRNRFQLVLADDINDSDNRLSSEMLFSALRDCEAQNKLLILDCCRAGKAAIDFNWEREAGEYLRILAATSSKETSLEVDGEVRGGLFTSWLYRALTVESVLARDADGYLRVDGLYNRLLRAWGEYRSADGRPGPKPKVYGARDEDLVLSDPISPPSGSDDEHEDLTQRLAALFSDSPGYPWGAWALDLRNALRPKPELEPPDNLAPSLARWLTGHTSERQPLAVVFLEDAAVRIRDGDRRLAERLAALANEIRDLHDSSDADVDLLRERVARDLHKTALVLSLSGGEDDVYSLEVYEFFNRGPGTEEEHAPPRELIEGQGHVHLAEPPTGAVTRHGVLSRTEAIGALMRHLERTRFPCGVEVVAAPRLLMSWEQAPEAWTDARGLTLSLRHPLVLRSTDGFCKENHLRHEHWRTVQKRGFKAHARTCTGLGPDALDRLRKDGRVAVLDACPEAVEQLALGTEGIGLSVMLWLRKPLPCGTPALKWLCSEIKSGKVRQLPERLSKLREAYAPDRDNPKARIGLLMDNPGRRRKRRPLSEPESTHNPEHRS